MHLKAVCIHHHRMGTDRSKVKSILPFLDIVLHLAAAAVKLKYLIRLQIFHGRNYECEHVDHLTIRLLNLEDYSSGMRPAAGLIHEFAVLCSVINLIFDGCMIQCVIGKSRILYQCRVQLQTNCIFCSRFPHRLHRCREKQNRCHRESKEAEKDTLYDIPEEEGS